jgi:hypothetical protein
MSRVKKNVKNVPFLFPLRVFRIGQSWALLLPHAHCVFPVVGVVVVVVVVGIDNVIVSIVVVVVLVVVVVVVVVVVINNQ